MFAARSSKAGNSPSPARTPPALWCNGTHYPPENSRAPACRASPGRRSREYRKIPPLKRRRQARHPSRGGERRRRRRPAGADSCCRPYPGCLPHSDKRYCAPPRPLRRFGEAHREDGARRPPSPVSSKTRCQSDSFPAFRTGLFSKGQDTFPPPPGTSPPGTRPGWRRFPYCRLQSSHRYG